MNCSADSLMESAKCFHCIPRAQSDAVAIYLLCQWSNNLNPPVEPLSWSPPASSAFWVDVFGAHNGDLPTFLATADIPTVSVLIAGTIPLTSITGLQNLTALTTLLLPNNNITSLDVSGMTTLTSVNATPNPLLTTIDVSGCTSLGNLDVSSCDITGTLNVSGLANLTTLNCAVNANLTTLNLTGCTGLTTLDCRLCNLGGLDVTTCSALDSLDCRSNPFNVNTTLDLSNCLSFNNLVADSCTSLTSVDMSNIVTMTGFITLDNSAALTTLTIPDLANLDEDIRITNCTSFGALSFPSLLHLGGELHCDGSSVTSISLPLCQDFGAISNGLIKASNAVSLASVDLTSLIGLNGTGDLEFDGCTSLSSILWPSVNFQPGAIMDFSDCALDAAGPPSPTIDTILSRAVASGIVANTIDLTGGTNLSHALWSAAALADETTLTGLGNVVLSNP